MEGRPQSVQTQYLMRRWRVHVPEDLVQELEQSIDGGPIVDEQGTVAIWKQLVARVQGVKVEIYSDEHGPPHFHVVSGGETNAFCITDCTPLHPGGLVPYFRNIRRWHAKNKPRLIETWNRLRPADCPVGPYRE